MGSVAFAGEDESQPSTSNGKKYKLPRPVKTSHYNWSMKL